MSGGWSCPVVRRAHPLKLTSCPCLPPVPVAEAIYVRRPVSRGIASSISINEKRDLDAQGLGRFLAPNESSVNAACYPVRPLSPPSSAHLSLAHRPNQFSFFVLQLYIEVFAPGPPHNLTAWFQKGTRQLSQTIFEWPRVDNPWVNENVSLSVTWERREYLVLLTRFSSVAQRGRQTEADFGAFFGRTVSIGPGVGRRLATSPGLNGLRQTLTLLLSCFEQSLASIIVQGYLDDGTPLSPPLLSSLSRKPS